MRTFAASLLAALFFALPVEAGAHRASDALTATPVGASAIARSGGRATGKLNVSVRVVRSNERPVMLAPPPRGCSKQSDATVTAARTAPPPRRPQAPTLACTAT